MKQFTDKADFKIRFQPFQLYPDLPRLHPDGVDKQTYFKKLGAQRNPNADEENQKQRFKFLQGEWKKDGLSLSDRGGKLGNSFDAQRLISFGRKQGREDQLIEAIYTANHENNLCLSNRSVLLACAEKAGVTGAKAMLDSDQEFEEVANKIQQYVAMGVHQVPFLIFNDKFPIEGAPDRRTLEAALKGLVEHGDNVEWPPKVPPINLDEFVKDAITLLKEASHSEHEAWSLSKLDWGKDDPRWLFLGDKILKGSNIEKAFGSALGELQERFKREANPKWDAAISSMDLALNRPATASSIKSSERAASFVVDGNPDTRWTSSYQDEQWLSVDLGSISQISRIEICWEAAHATSYLLQGSNDGDNWTTWTSVVGHKGWVTTSLPTGCEARWVRMFGQKRATEFGFSIWEFRAFA